MCLLKDNSTQILFAIHWASFTPHEHQLKARMGPRSSHTRGSRFKLVVIGSVTMDQIVATLAFVLKPSRYDGSCCSGSWRSRRTSKTLTNIEVKALKARIATIRRATQRDSELCCVHPCACPLAGAIDFPSWEVMVLAMKMAKAGWCMTIIWRLHWTPVYALTNAIQ